MRFAIHSRPSTTLWSDEVEVDGAISSVELCWGILYCVEQDGVVEWCVNSELCWPMVPRIEEDTIKGAMESEL